MTLQMGRRVKLATDLRLAGSVVPADGSSATDAGAATLSLAAGAEGTVERVDEHGPAEQSQEVREYVRLKALLDDFGDQMPPGSKKKLEEEIASLEPEWAAHQEQRLRATVRVRLDNGFVLDDAPEDLFTSV